MTRILAATVGFWLFSVPGMRISIAGIPIYLIDGAIVALALTLRSLPLPRGRTFTHLWKVLQAYLALVLISELYGAAINGIWQYSLFVVFRYAVAFLVVPSVIKLLYSRELNRPFFRGVLAALLFSSAITLGFSLPATRPFVARAFQFNPLFKNQAGDWQERVLENDSGTRGHSLIGVSTMTAGVLGTLWPLTFALLRRRDSKGGWHKAAILATILVPLGLLSTYGRGAWVTASVISLLVLGPRSGVSRKPIFLAVGAALSVLLSEGVESKNLYISRIVMKTRVTLERPLTGGSETERIYSYIEPFQYTADHPSYLFWGSGFAEYRAFERGVIDEMQADRVALATHSGFAYSVYSFGMLATVIHIYFLASLAASLVTRRRENKGASEEVDSAFRSALLMWVGWGLWWLTGWAMVVEPRALGATFMTTGLSLGLIGWSEESGSSRRGPGSRLAPSIACPNTDDGALEGLHDEY